jgi:hypothetical protein
MTCRMAIVRCLFPNWKFFFFFFFFFLDSIDQAQWLLGRATW